MCLTFALLFCVLASEARAQDFAPPVNVDVVVFGGTPGGITAAIAAARHGHTVALVEPSAHVGGVVSGGLVDTDTGNRDTIGGIADDFFKRTLAHYRDTYGPDSKQFKACHNGLKYEPHVAEQIYEQMLKEQPKIAVHKRQELTGAPLAEGKITAIITRGDKNVFTIFGGKVFIDASYTGDLMAQARVPYRIGREAQSEFGEVLAGVRAGPKEQIGLGDHRIMAYNYRVSITSNPNNRVLFPKPADYDPIPWEASYGKRVKRTGVEGFAGLFVSAIGKAGPNDKYDTNWCDYPGANEGYAEGDAVTRARIEARQRDYFLSLLYYLQNDPDLPAKFHDEVQNWGLPRDEFVDNGHFPHQLYVREARRMLGRYVLRESDLTTNRSKADGVCAGSYGIDCHVIRRVPVNGKDEPDHTPHAVVLPYDIPYACLTPHEPANLLVPVCLSATHVAYCSLRMEPVFMMLGHAGGDAAHLAIAGNASVQKVDPTALRALLQSEGAVVDAGYHPTVRIAWSPRHPKVGEKVQFRVESSDLKDPLATVWWDFDGTGKVGAQGEKVEHAFTMDKAYSVSLLVEDKARRRRLVSASVPVGLADNSDVSMNDYEAVLAGRWQSVLPRIVLGKGQTIPDVYTGPSAHQDMILRGKKVAARARFQPEFARPGRYAVVLGFRPAKGLASNAPITIKHAGGVARLTLDQRAADTPFPFVPLGEYRFKAGNSGFVEVMNADTDGKVSIDGVRWVWLGE